MRKIYSKGSDENLIVEVQDDGTERIIDIDMCNDTVDKVMESLFNLEEQVERFDVATACYGLFINAYYILLSAGWSMGELVKDMEEHLEDHKRSLN